MTASAISRSGERIPAPSGSRPGRRPWPRGGASAAFWLNLPHERLVRRVEEEDVDRAPPPRSSSRTLERVREKLLPRMSIPRATQAPSPPRLGDDVDDLGKENRWQVVHAIVAEVLEHP